MQITLNPKNPESNLPPMVVETDQEKWPKIVGGENLNNFHGVGTLSKQGYDVSNIPKGVGNVHEVPKDQIDDGW